MATIHDVARESNVSITTVSTVLNNSNRPVSEMTRRRVLQVAKRLNYHPNAAARALSSHRMHTLGVLFCTIEPTIVSNDYAATVLQGIFGEGAARHWDIHLFTSQWINAEQSAPMIHARRTDGTLVIGPTIDFDAAPGLEAIGQRIVVVSAPSGISGVPYVDLDNAAAGRLVAEHLIALGHRRIAHMRGTLDQRSVWQRSDAFIEMLRKENIVVSPEYLPGGSFRQGDAYQTARVLLHLPDPPTAIFTTNDDMAYGVLQAARDLGVRVPEELSVVGCDDYRFSQVTVPPLTTIHHPLVKIGSTAASLLIDRIEDRSTGRDEHLFAPELIVRGSTAPASR